MKTVSLTTMAIIVGLFAVATAQMSNAQSIILAGWNSAPDVAVVGDPADVQATGINATITDGDGRVSNGSNDGTYGPGEAWLPSAPTAANGTYYVNTDDGITFSLTNNFTAAYLIEAVYFDYSANWLDGQLGEVRSVGFTIDGNLQTVPSTGGSANATKDYNDVTFSCGSIRLNPGEVTSFSLSSENTGPTSFDNIALVGREAPPSGTVIAIQ